MGCKQQMVTLYQRRALGSSAQPSLLFFELKLNLGIVCSESRLEPASFLPRAPRPESVYRQSFPIALLPPASLLEIPLWRRQSPDSLVQLHLKDLITPVDTCRLLFLWPRDSPGLYLSDWLRRSDLITDLIDMLFSFSLLACLSVPISVFLSSRRGVEDQRDTR